MGVIAMTVQSPVHGQVIVGSTDVLFEARLDTVGAGEMFVRWYSTLPSVPDGLPDDLGTPPDLDKIALSPQSTALSLRRKLLVGSQAITLAVKDRPGDDEAALKAVRQAGMAGGGPDSPAPCVVHVLIADSIVPRPPATPQTVVPMTRAAGIWAQAPPGWTDMPYQRMNRLAYTWTFAPSSGAAVELRPSADQLDVLPRQNPLPPRVGFSAIPALLPPGDYRMTLQVVYSPDSSKFAEISLAVRIVD